jgi:hypothetical protein
LYRSALHETTFGKSNLKSGIPANFRISEKTWSRWWKMRCVSAIRKNYARALYLVADATPDDVREAVTTLEDVERIARRVFGGSHPITEGMEPVLRTARAVLSAREAGIPYAFKMVS